MIESIGWFMTALKKNADFSSRACKKEYWYFILIYALTFIPLLIVDVFTGTVIPSLGLGFLSGVYMLFMLYPLLAVTARRLHDVGQSGWWQLLNLIPLLGFVVILFFSLQDSQPHDNIYGPQQTSTD